MLKLKCLVYSVYTSTVTGLHVLWSIQPLPGVNSEFLSNQDSNISKPSPLNLSWYAECQVLFFAVCFLRNLSSNIYPTPTFILLLHSSYPIHSPYSYIHSTPTCICTPTFILLLHLFYLPLHLSCFSSYSYIHPVSHPTPTFILFLIQLLHLSCSSSYSYIYHANHPTPTFILFWSYFYIYHNPHAYPIPAIMLLLHPNLAFILILILFHVDATVWSLSLIPIFILLLFYPTPACISPAPHPIPTFILLFILFGHSFCSLPNSYIYPAPYPIPTFIPLLILFLHLSCSSSCSYIYPALHPTTTFIPPPHNSWINAFLVPLLFFTRHILFWYFYSSSRVFIDLSFSGLDSVFCQVVLFHGSLIVRLLIKFINP